MSLVLYEDTKSETLDTEFDSNKTFRQTTSLSDNEMDTDNIDIGVEDVKPFEFVEVENESLLAKPVSDNFFTCEECDEKFKLCESLQQHILDLHCSHKCSICNATFTRQSYLKIHLLVHAGIKPFKCSLCSSQYYQRYQLKKHLVNIHKLDENSFASLLPPPIFPSTYENPSYRAYVCKICDATYTSYNFLQDHIQSFHKKLKPYFKCNVCGACFTKQSYLNLHSVKHSREKIYKCSICNQDFTLKTCLKDHLIKAHKQNITADFVQNKQPTFSIDQKEQTVCEKCNMQFSSHENLSQHVCIIQDSAKIEPFEEHDTEFDTNERFGQNTTLSGNEMDTDNTEIGVEPFEFVEVNKSLLAEPVTDNSLTCGKSNEEFSSHENLQEHNLISNDSDALKCSECNAIFIRKCNLNSHLLLHSDVKPFSCSLCSYKSKRKNNLKVHLVNTHKLDKNSVASLLLPSSTNENPSYRAYVCKICDATYTSYNFLQDHIQSFHKKLKPYFKCNVCGACFTKQSYLNLHSVKHSREKIYKCSICSQDFTLKTCLEDHLIKAHKQNATADFVQNKQPTFSIVQKEQTVCEKCNVQFSSHENLSQHVCTIQDNVKSGPFEEHDTEFDSNETFGQNTTLSGNEMDTDNIEIGAEDVKPFEIVEVKTETLLAEPDNSLTCGKCNDEFSKFSSLKNLKIHDSVVHAHKTTFECSKCNETFTSLSNLKFHRQTHAENIICTICSSKFMSKIKFKKHLQYAHRLDKESLDKDMKPFICKDPTTPIITNLFICKICNIEFDSSYALKEHVNNMKSKPGDVTYQCSKCILSFTCQASLDSHQKIHVKFKPITCMLCSFSSDMPCNLKKHLLKVHKLKFVENSESSLLTANKRTFVCEPCHLSYAHNVSLQNHVKSIHLGFRLKPFQCNHCGAWFTKKIGLNKHLTKNSTKKPYKCSMCCEKFRFKVTLKLHMCEVHCIDSDIDKPIIQNVSKPVEKASIEFKSSSDKICYSESTKQIRLVNIHKTANLTSGLQHSPPKPQLRQYVARIKVRQPDCKLTASSLPEMWITKVKPCCVQLDRGEVTRYLSRLDKREVTEERGSPIEGLPPPLATPAPPVRDDPRHPCGAVSVTSDLLLGD